MSHGKCKHCGESTSSHPEHECRHKHSKCYVCQERGHISTACPKRQVRHASGQAKHGKPPKSKAGTHQVESVADVDSSSNSSDGEEDTYSLYALSSKSCSPPLRVDVSVCSKPLRMDVDTGATFSVIGETTYRKLLSDKSLESSNIVLETYDKQQIHVVGELPVTVGYKDQTYENLRLCVVPGERTPLLGRDWMQKIRLEWSELFSVNSVAGSTNEEFWKVKYPALFEPGIGKVRDYQATIRLKSDAKPKFCRARPVSYADVDKVSSELDRLEEAGIIKPVVFAEWASPVVIVPKSDGNIRICGDFKTTVNPCIEVDQYPLPTPEDLFAQLSGSTVFSKLDLSHAYQQIELDEESRKLLVINTHKGLRQYTRLPFGVASAAAIFQRVIESVLQGIPSTATYQDDILIGGRTWQEHNKTLDQILSRLNSFGLRLKIGKCQFGVTKVQYLGFGLSAAGIEPLPDKIRPILDAPEPTNVSELKSFLGCITYYSKFLPDLSSSLEPLHVLLRNAQKWYWSSEQQLAFEKAKLLLLDAPVLCHYDPCKPLVVHVDASPYGLGAVLSHLDSDGCDHPIAFASRKLSSAERNYSQLDKEALAVVYGVTKFHKYVSGRVFTIVTDHKPLLGIIGEGKAIPQLSSPRMHRWAVSLAAYSYHLVYREGSKNGNADCLSRLPVGAEPKFVPVPGEIHQVFSHVDTVLSVKCIRRGTASDPVLSKVVEWLQSGWPDDSFTPDSEVLPYFRRRNELSLHDGCVLFGSRVVVPPSVRQRILHELHELHPGVTRMKALARSYVYWPNIDSDIETIVKKCVPCQENRKSPPSASLHPWEWPNKPWYRVHVDYAGPIDGKMFLILVDAHSKWMDVHIVPSTNAQSTIEKFEQSFATLGLPQVMVSDNGSMFTSSEMQHFLSSNGIKHITSAPYHPSSNGLAERAVQTFKSAMKKLSGISWQSRVSKFLARYRITPHSTTGSPPALLMFGRRPRCALDRVKPDLSAKVIERQEQQKLVHDSRAKDREFSAGDKVFYRDYSTNASAKYSPGVIVRSTGPVSVEVKDGNDQLHRRHHDQLLQRDTEESSLPVEQSTTNETECGVKLSARRNRGVPKDRLNL